MTNSIILGVIMDDIAQIHPEKDTTLALLLKAQSRGWQIHYMELNDLFLQYGTAWGRCQRLFVEDNVTKWYHLEAPKCQPLDQFDILLMRKDPPVDMEYIYATHILEQAESNGSLVVNKPQSLRDANEKLSINWFPQCIAPTLVTSQESLLREFIQEHETVVLKALEGMGGSQVYKCSVNDPNLSVILKTLSHNGKKYIMAQRFIPDIIHGDKRIILIDGDPLPFALARVPKEGEFRGNLAAGGLGHGIPLTARDYWICEQVGPTLREKGLLLVGLDVIGDYLTEINVTSPTCVRELEKAFNMDISGRILDCMAEKLEDA